LFRRYRKQAMKRHLKHDGSFQTGSETPSAGTNRASGKTWKTTAVGIFTRGRNNRQGTASSLQHYRKQETVPAIATESRGVVGAGGGGNGTAVSWQRLRPLPIPMQSDANPGNRGALRKSATSATAYRNAASVMNDSQQPLLSPISPIAHDVTHVRTVSYGDR